MAKLSKEKKGKALTPADIKKLSDSIVLLKTTYANVLSVWSQCTPSQKIAYLQNSPILADLLSWSERWK